ncbi:MULTISPECIES: Crp/Fnr family transcriptional regulator [Nonlabens]|uniref:Crp/Fnr family transcriptional regulator n=1 Tax=Nonlabens TaxID=363408 RepID=UPI000CF438C5|nr:Crp/Fnr family transcriptional regulator [Nonlabens tegetincola]PQJ18285.1 Crp/Fnr family transcriptional regulator [Nonlabens tegetincola]
MIQELKNSYGHLFESALINEILQVGTYKVVPAGFKLMEIGSYVKGMPLLVSGAIKVLREDKNGDELLLYYLEKGETCSMTMTCCMGQTKSEIRAIAETDTKLIMIPIQKMEVWTSKYRSWRNFVFESYHNRLNEMLLTMDSIAFDNMDERLLNYLKEKARINKDNIIHSTHQEIAYELHSSRVVISRLLKKLENLGSIELHRNYIEIINLD